MAMKLYDTHAHFGPHEDETARVLARAQEAGVTRLMAVGGSAELNAAAVRAQALRPDAGRERYFPRLKRPLFFILIWSP